MSQKPQLPVKTSKCGMFTENPRNAQYFLDQAAIDKLNSQKETLFKTEADFKKNIVDVINTHSPKVQYQISTSSKYLQLKCT